MTSLPTHADAMAKTLADSGIRYAFGLPGGEISVFLEACRRAGIQVVLTGHESSAALIAQVMGQITGVPGLCFATLGPGATNLVTGVSNALLDRAPLVAVTAQIPNSCFETLSHQRLATEKLFAPITKRTAVIGDGDTRNVTLDSLRLAAAPRPGPVMLVLPSDIATQASNCRCGPTDADVEANDAQHAVSLTLIHKRIAKAERPLVIIGLGTPPSASASVKNLVEVLHVPFLVTPKAKGILPEDHPLFLGVASGMAIDREVLEVVKAADLVISIGFDPVEADKTWFADIETVAVDSASMIGGNYHPREAIGDVAFLCSRLVEMITQPRPWPRQLLKKKQQSLKRVPRESGGYTSPLKLIQTLRSVFPNNGIVSCDVGSHKLLMGQFWKTYEPGTFFMSNGLSGMGFGIPAAIAAQFAYPDRPVMTVVGDGGMLMMIHDLVLIHEMNLPIIIVVLVDNSLSLIRISQERRGFPACGVDFRSPRFDEVAEAFGVRGELALSVGDAAQCVERAIAERRSLLLEVPVDLREYYELI